MVSMLLLKSSGTEHRQLPEFPVTLLQLTGIGQGSQSAGLNSAGSLDGQLNVSKQTTTLSPIDVLIV